MTTVPNRFPTQPSPRRIALIGEAPGRDDVQCRQPFTGMSGRFLAALLSRAGSNREACFLGNISQCPGPIEQFKWDGPEVQIGLRTLLDDLGKYQPHVVVLLGNIPLKAFKDRDNIHDLTKGFKNKTSQWRGSLFLSPEGYKCMATYHPSYVLRDYETAPLLQLDLRKAIDEAHVEGLVLPPRRFEVGLQAFEIIDRLRQLRAKGKLVGTDIEGYWNRLSCIAFADSPNHAFIVPFFRKDGSACFLPHEECQLWRELALTLEDPGLPKVWQNGLYDRFCLQYGHGIRVKGNREDIMLKHWELYSELEKSLALQASIYTKEPYYKGDRAAQDDKTFYEYCCRDAAVTLEIATKLEGMRQYNTLSTTRRHYELNIGLLNPLLYMELRGMRYDITKAANRRKQIAIKLYETQALFNASVGLALPFVSVQSLFLQAVELMGFKKSVYLKTTDLIGNCKKDYLPSASRLVELLNQPNPTLATIGELETLLKAGLNVGSKALLVYLYETLKLPIQYNDDKTDPKPTADYEALLNLSKFCQKNGLSKEYEIVQNIITIRALATRERMLSIGADPDGRIRCGYNIVGSDTGRVTCYTSPTGSGYNLQTIPKYQTEAEAPGGIIGDRDLFLADDGHWLFQCDLSGADGWTVAAYCKFLGDPTMLDDYNAGIKPAKVLALMQSGRLIDWGDREVLRYECKSINSEDWIYFACKRVQHGANYLEGPNTIGRNILTDSEGKLYLEQSECKKLKDLYFRRYPGIPRWHEYIGGLLRQRPVLTAASGQVRQFFGRANEIITKAVAFEPQANTTYATNLAMRNLWSDNENRNVGGRRGTHVSGGHGYGTTMDIKLERRMEKTLLRIEPLHQVHDALNGQFKKEDTTWAVGKIKSYFNNPLTICGQQITIPFEGSYGPSWGEKEGSI